MKLFSQLPTLPDIEFDHVGIAVKSLQDNEAFWKVLGWEEKGEKEPELVTDQKVRVEMLPLKNSCNVELLEATEDSSPINQFIQKRGPGIHHICFRVKNIKALLEKLKEAGVRLIHETAVRGAHDCLVAFVHPSATGGVLIELSEPTQMSTGFKSLRERG